MNGTHYQTAIDRLEEMIAAWRIEWLKAIDELLRPAAKETT